MIEVGDFRLCDETLELHAEGIRLATRDRLFNLAHHSFSGAIEQVKAGSEKPISVRQLQVGRILRDDGFTHVREALIHQSPAAAKQLVAAVNKIGTSKMLLDMVMGRGNLSEPALSFVEGERGATQGALARYATAAFVLGEQSGIGNPAGYYDNAHIHLVRGDNYYYLVSNAICAARQAELDRDPSARNLWLDRATRGKLEARQKDPQNFLRADATYEERLAHLGDYKTAFDSVFEKP